MSNDLLAREDSEVPLTKPDMDAVREMLRNIVRQHGGKIRITGWENGQFSFFKAVLTFKWIDK